MKSHPTHRLTAGQAEPELVPAQVLFMDVVSYEKLPMDRQLEVKRRLDGLVASLPEFQRARAENQVVSLPTGDGMALAFFQDYMAPVVCARKIALALKEEREFSLRIGIHAGSVYRDADINANLNIVGGGINSAQRVMDLGDGGHILVSKAIAETLLQLSVWKAAVHELGQAKVKHGEIVHVFNIFNEEFGNPRRPAKMFPSSSAEGGAPNRGRLVAKLCDRIRQESEFLERVREVQHEHPGSPQVFFIPGEEGQCHESLVERLQFRLAEFGVVSGAGRIGAGRSRKIAWQHEGETAQRVSRLVYSLFEELSPTGGGERLRSKDLSARTFGDLLTACLNSHIAIEHEIHASRWDDSTEEALSSYLQFWSELEPSADRPPVVVFVSVIFLPSNGSMWTAMRPAKMMASLRKKRVISALTTLERMAKVPTLTLAELPAITRDDVRDWFFRHQIYNSEEQRLRTIDRLFPDGTLRPKAMYEIEKFLGEELRTLAAEGGAL